MPFLEKQQLMNLTPGHTRDASEKTGGSNSKPAAFKFKLFCDDVVIFKEHFPCNGSIFLNMDTFSGYTRRLCYRVSLHSFICFFLYHSRSF